MCHRCIHTLSIITRFWQNNVTWKQAERFTQQDGGYIISGITKGDCLYLGMTISYRQLKHVPKTKEPCKIMIQIKKALTDCQGLE